MDGSSTADWCALTATAPTTYEQTCIAPGVCSANQLAVRLFAVRPRAPPQAALSAPNEGAAGCGGLAAGRWLSATTGGEACVALRERLLGFGAHQRARHLRCGARGSTGRRSAAWLARAAACPRSRERACRFVCGGPVSDRQRPETGSFLCPFCRSRRKH
jgi:hypothetical protein